MAQLFRRLALERDAALRRPSSRFGAAFRDDLAVRFVIVVAALPLFVLPVALFDVRAPAVFAFAASNFLFNGVVLVAVLFPVTRLAERGSGCEVSSIVSLSADPSARSASPAGPSRGSFLVFTGCQVCGDPIVLCLRSSRAASSWVSRPRCVYVPGFTLFCLLICGT